MQVLSLTLMEPPGADGRPGHPRREGQGPAGGRGPDAGPVLNDVVRAQYDSGWGEGVEVPGYRAGAGRGSPTVMTETYVAMQLHVDNWRWAGVPIFVRTGKRLPKRVDGGGAAVPARRRIWPSPGRAAGSFAPTRW